MTFYDLIRVPVTAFQFLLMPQRVVCGKENTDPETPVIYCINHRHAGDPFRIAAAVKKQIAFMAKKEIFRHKIVAWFVTKLNAFPVDRSGADVSAVKTAVNRLKEGYCVGIFPEGTRYRDSFEMQSVHTGAVWIAVRAGVPVVPVFLDGGGLFRRTRIYFGEKLFFSVPEGGRFDAGLREEYALTLQSAVNALAERAKAD